LGKINKKLFGRIETLISQDTKVDGVIEAVGTLRVDGSITGGISKADGVIIGTTGFVKGDVKAKGVSLAGKVIGNIYAAVAFELLPGSVLKGDIQTAQLSISEGAHFDGACTMLDEADNFEENIPAPDMEAAEDVT
jgi:cytoskeletal protein CcmA (bactofilin family)